MLIHLINKNCHEKSILNAIYINRNSYVRQWNRCKRTNQS